MSSGIHRVHPRTNFEIAQLRRKRSAPVTAERIATKSFYLRIVARAITEENRTLEYVGEGALDRRACTACTGRTTCPAAASHIVKNAHGAGWSALLCHKCAAETERLTGIRAEQSQHNTGGSSTSGVRVQLPKRS